MTIHNLMADENARAEYLAIPANRAPLDLASDYMLAKLDGDKSLCLAIECHARELAQIHFQRADVRECLATIERVKASPKPGNGGTKDLQYIADEIARKYRDREYETADGKAMFTISPKSGGTLRLGCINTPGHVAWMAAKYRRGIPKSRSGRYGTHNAIT